MSAKRWLFAGASVLTLCLIGVAGLMVKSLKLIETTPILLGAKSK